jgi:hypothetical protein
MTGLAAAAAAPLTPEQPGPPLDRPRGRRDGGRACWDRRRGDLRQHHQRELVLRPRLPERGEAGGLGSPHRPCQSHAGDGLVRAETHSLTGMRPRFLAAALALLVGSLLAGCSLSSPPDPFAHVYGTGVGPWITRAGWQQGFLFGDATNNSHSTLTIDSVSLAGRGVGSVVTVSVMIAPLVTGIHADPGANYQTDPPVNLLPGATSRRYFGSEATGRSPAASSGCGSSSPRASPASGTSRRRSSPTPRTELPRRTRSLSATGAPSAHTPTYRDCSPPPTPRGSASARKERTTCTSTTTATSTRNPGRSQRPGASLLLWDYRDSNSAEAEASG